MNESRSETLYIKMVGIRRGNWRISCSSERRAIFRGESWRTFSAGTDQTATTPVQVYKLRFHILIFWWFCSFLKSCQVALVGTHCAMCFCTVLILACVWHLRILLSRKRYFQFSGVIGNRVGTGTRRKGPPVRFTVKLQISCSYIQLLLAFL